MTDHDLEHRLTDALDTAADAVPSSTPPTFSWQSPAPAARPPRRRRAVYAGSGLVAAAVVAAVVATTLSAGTSHAAPKTTPHALGTTPFTPTSSSNRTSSAAPQNASTMLLAAAHLRLQAGDPPLADGQFRYVRIVSPAPDVISYDKSDQPHTVAPPAGSYTLDQYWIPKDETDVWMRRQSVVGDPQGGAPDVWKGRCDDLYADTQDGPKGPACTRPGSFDDPTPAFIASLPRNADALYARLHTYAEQHLNPDKIDDADFEMFTTIDSLLDSGVISGDLTSTLYRVLSRIPGIIVVRNDENYSGVAGTGFELSTRLGHTYRDTQTIIVDLQSGTYLGDRDVSAGQDYSSAVSYGVADRIGQPGN